MCGGVMFPYKTEYRGDLEQFYSPEDVDEFSEGGVVRSLYWQRGEPVLPVVVPADAEGSEPRERLLRWGNRDKKAPFPQTGWARIDSIEQGKWDYLKPKQVVIPVTYGVEKGKWFPIEKGIQGVVVERGGEQRVYMLTDDATPEFLDTTHHGRMPVLVEQESFNWLPAEPSGTEVATGN